MALLAAATVDTQYWFRADRYDKYINQFQYATPVLGRNLLLIAILAILAAPARRFRRPRYAPGDA
jgi:hypothetical protein